MCLTYVITYGNLYVMTNRTAYEETMTDIHAHIDELQGREDAGSIPVGMTAAYVRAARLRSDWTEPVA